MRSPKITSANFSVVSFCVLFVSISLSVVYPLNIPKTWQEFIQNCISSSTSSEAKQCFSNVFYPLGGEHVPNEDLEADMIPPIILCDLAGPYCQLSLRVWRLNDGTTSHTTPHTIFCIQQRVLLVSCVYLCSGKHHQVVAHDPELLKTICETGIRIPFILFHKSGMTKELFDVISSSTQAGLCIQDIANMLLNLHNSNRCGRAFLYYSQCRDAAANFALFNPKKGFIGRMLITRAFLRAFTECENMYTQHMASQIGKWLSADHTFKISANIGYWKNKQWVKLYNSVFIVMNECNKVLAWQLARGTSIDTMETLLTGSKEQHQNAKKELEGFIIDNCCSVKNNINAIFGSTVVIKLDLFHALKRILDQILRKGVTAEMRGVRHVMIKNLRL